MTEGLLRQRRNLIITSVLLWLMKYGGVKFTKLSLAGFDITFKEPLVLVLSLWIAFAYFLFRYYQYFSSEGVSNLISVFFKSVETKCQPIIRALIKQKHPNWNNAPNYSYELLKKWKWVYHGQLVNIDSMGGTDPTENFELPIDKRKLRKGIFFATIDTTFRNSVVTDYLLPFILAGIVLWYCGSDDWDGSFFRFIFP